MLAQGKGDKVRYLPLHAVSAERIHSYLKRSADYLTNPKAPLFIPLRGRQTGAGVTANGIYTLVEAYAKKAGIEVAGLGVHGLRPPRPPRPPMRWSMRRTSPRSRPGWVTQASVPRGSMIAGRADLGIHLQHGEILIRRLSNAGGTSTLALILK